jgi:putative DNA primase/helicase
MSNDWTKQLLVTVTKAGATRKNCGENIYKILENDPRFKDNIRRNIFKNETEVNLAPHHGGPTVWRALSDVDSITIANYIQRTWDIDADDGAVFKQIMNIAAKHAYDPLAEMFAALPEWDGTPRLDSWLHTHLGAEDNEYHRLVGRAWMIGAVARALSPGEKMDTVISLEGTQGVGKSTTIAILAGPGFSSDTPIDIGTKDARGALQGVWIVELAELESLRKSDATKSKGWFSQREDKFRPPYGRVEVTVPRRCVFAGTSNRDDYLQDETGNRRYWPVACGQIDLKALARDRDQLWAEAQRAYKAGESWHLDSAEKSALAEAQAFLRVEEDPWTMLIDGFLGPRQHAIVTRDEVFAIALKKNFGTWDPALAKRVGSTLRRLGWIKVHQRVGGKARYFYQYRDQVSRGADAYIEAEARRSRALEIGSMSDFERSEAADRYPLPAKPSVSA